MAGQPGWLSGVEASPVDQPAQLKSLSLNLGFPYFSLGEPELA
jgi:hypothetical protein